MARHLTGEEVEFITQYPIVMGDRKMTTGDSLTIVLARDWDEEEGQGQGGPWGWGGYPSQLVASLTSNNRVIGHTHTCIDCTREIAYGEFDCESDTDHAFERCEQCAKEH